MAPGVLGLSGNSVQVTPLSSARNTPPMPATYSVGGSRVLGLLGLGTWNRQSTASEVSELAFRIGSTMLASPKIRCVRLNRLLAPVPVMFCQVGGVGVVTMDGMPLV